ncbi:MAG: histidine phosphatase family protein [Pseudomonadota bacterium]
MTVYVARHGETEWNRAGRMQGRLGAPLAERGHAQARALARFAQRVGVQRVIASPLARALDTARYTVEALACPLARCDALMELDFGDCTGLTEADIAERYPTLRPERERDKWRHRWPGGESYADAFERIARAFDGGELPGEPGTLIVAHQALNRVLSRRLAGAPESAVLAMAQPSTVVLRFEHGAVSHARIPEDDGEPIVWEPGLYGSSKR